MFKSSAGSDDLYIPALVENMEVILVLAPVVGDPPAYSIVSRQ